MDNKEPRKKFNLGDTLRERSRLFDADLPDDDIGEIWEDQKRMQAEDRKLEKDLREAKMKARELKKELYKNKFGESTTKTTEFFANGLEKIKGHAKKLYYWTLKNRKFSLPAALLLIGMLGWSLFGAKVSNPQTLGDSSKVYTDQELVREKPAFSLLYRSGTTSDQYDVVRISPAGSEPSYTYLDRFNEKSPIIRVTQQEVPKDFDLKEAATNFQANNIIQIDGENVYHGYNDKVNVQSLIFIKNKKLIFISSPQKFNDDQWVAYITSLR